MAKFKELKLGTIFCTAREGTLAKCTEILPKGVPPHAHNVKGDAIDFSQRMEEEVEVHKYAEHFRQELMRGGMDVVDATALTMEIASVIDTAVGNREWRPQIDLDSLPIDSTVH